MILLILFSLFGLSMGQEHKLFTEVGKKIHDNNIILTCNVTFTDREFVHLVEWYKNGFFLATNNLEYLYSESRKRIKVCSFINITSYTDESQYNCQIGTTLEVSPAKYVWENVTKKMITPANYVSKTHYKSIYLNKDDLPKIMKEKDEYDQNYWTSYYAEEEGNSAVIRCMTENESTVWYKGKNELIVNTGRVNIEKNYLIINNLTLSDGNVYRCNSPDNEFYTVLMVRKNYRKY